MKTIQLTMINDVLPELVETLLVNLTSIQLLNSRHMNFAVINGLQIDIPPKIGPQSTISISVSENDNPYGTIQFTQQMRLVHEWEGRIAIQLERTGMIFRLFRYFSFKQMGSSISFIL